MSDLISVIIPVYNMGNSLETCVSSVLAQENVDFEVILVDDGSMDNSWERCLCLQEKDKRVSAFHTENRGSGPARNYGMEQAKGRYAYFPDADDQLAQGALHIMLESIRKNDADLLVFGYQALDQKGEVRRRKIYPDFVREGEAIRRDYSDYAGMKTKYGIQGAPWNKMFDLEIVRKYGIAYPPLRRHQDEGFIARYMNYSVRVQFIADVLYTHHMNDLSLEWKKFPANYTDIVRALYDTRRETILSWNPEDRKTHQIIHEEYVDALVKALELSWSPKHSFKSGERKKWIADQVEKSDICQLEIYSDYSIYKKALLHLFRMKWYGLAMLAMKMKIRAEKKGLDQMSNKYNA